MAGKKKSFPLRLDQATYEALERWAADEFRSVNGHIEFLLREALRDAGRLPGPKRITNNNEE
ncbi:toxin-antitoxin system HicB family antitoxin [Paenibacillus shunpengii]|uniref:Toxin-antitoxin system HicB family antitoxin n=1 Tax=Paenibacillus shunpengii TaxID=2054424 RepID=A0ABW5SRD4_9BACL|nr:toxin-antitoxin system HicB family antitoxin [Paenibacillus sp. PDC88]SDW68908.1 hypothetical protein SAMN05518848_102693 [Paenibacillus sp. PDC88]